MSNDKLRNVIAETLHENFEIDKTKLLANENLISLGLDSLDFMDISFVLQEALSDEDDEAVDIVLKEPLPTNLDELTAYVSEKMETT